MRKFNVGWGLTNACNMNCEFCYSKETRAETENSKLQDWKRFVEENHNFIDSINYGTGENSVIDDFFWFIDFVRKAYPQIKQAVTTNGYIYERITTNNEFKEIFLRSIDEVDISLDFADKEKHNMFRGQPKAYDWATNLLKFLSDKDIKTTIVFIGFDETLKKDNLDGLFEIAKENKAILRMNIYRPVSKQDIINSKFILKYSVLKKALEYINEKYEIINLSDMLLGNVFTNATDIKDFSGTKSIRILPNGDICPSTYLIDETYRNKFNIKDRVNLETLKFPAFDTPPIPKDCKSCKYATTCRGGVFDRRILWYGSFEERDPYCPLRNGDTLPVNKFHVSKNKRISVHDDYLPTLFFKNKD